MNKLGKYQNNIDDLSTLDLEHYERIFKLYITSNNDKDFYFYNILRRISMPDNLDSGVSRVFKVKTPLPLTIISYNIYQDIRLWWLLLLLNKKEIGKNIFVVPGGVEIKYIAPESLTSVFQEITNLTIYNGRHY